MGSKVLIVEDEKLNREILKDIFQSIYKHVYTATDGESGLNSFIDKKPDIIITDLRMQRMDGITMIEKIQELKKDQPFVIVSAHSDHEYLQKAEQLGIKNFLVKPVDCRKLLKITRDLLNYA